MFPQFANGYSLNDPMTYYSPNTYVTSPSNGFVQHPAAIVRPSRYPPENQIPNQFLSVRRGASLNPSDRDNQIVNSRIAQNHMVDSDYDQYQKFLTHSGSMVRPRSIHAEYQRS